MSRIKSSIVRKFALLYLMMLISCLVLISGLQYFSMRNLAYSSTKSSVADVSAVMKAILVERPEVVGSEAFTRSITRFQRELADVSTLNVMDSAFRITNSSEAGLQGKALHFSAAEAAMLRAGDDVRRYWKRGGKPYYTIYQPITGQGEQAGRLLSVIETESGMSHVDTRLRLATATAAWWFFILLIPPIVVLFIATHRVAIRPIATLTAAAERFARTGEEMELALRSGDEMEVLANTFSSMTSERARSEARLRAATTKADEANRSKGEFLANMSHEIRTPMNGVLGMLELALTTELTTEQRDYVQTARSSAESLLSVINDILDFSKIEAGKLELERIRFALADSISDLLAPLAVRAHKKGLELTLHVAPDVPDALIGDVTRLRQVLINLVNNAIKFTADGEVVVDVSRKSGDENAVVLQFTVRDTGIGIPKNKLEHIFEAFAQADSSTTREYGGTGLGLAIVARLVRALGGEIWVDSMVGRGSDFHFTARYQVDTDEGFGIADLAALEDLAVLIIDDNATNRRILEQVLRNWRMRPTTVASGPEALSTLRTARQAGMRFPLILLDAQMPGMDGFELAQRIQHDAELQGAAIMMLSSLAGSQEVERCRELGIGQCLTKPVRQSQLLDSILMAIAASPLRPGKADNADRFVIEHADRKLRILLAEDNPVNQKLAVALLRKRGHEVQAVDNGRAAVAAVERQHFDVVLMDLQMPILGGMEATSEIRAAEAGSGRHIPIVAMTARAMPGDRERCLEAGMDGYISKPIRAQDLFDTIESNELGALPRSNSNVAGDQEIQRFDKAALLDLVGGDANLLQELYTLFELDGERLLNDLRVALQSGDADALQFTAHTLKGAAANLQGGMVRSLANRIENLASEQALDSITPLVEELASELKLLDVELRALVDAELGKGQPE